MIVLEILFILAAGGSSSSSFKSPWKSTKFWQELFYTLQTLLTEGETIKSLKDSLVTDCSQFIFSSSFGNSYIKSFSTLIIGDIENENN